MNNHKILSLKFFWKVNQSAISGIQHTKQGHSREEHPPVRRSIHIVATWEMPIKYSYNYHKYTMVRHMRKLAETREPGTQGTTWQ